MVPSCCNVDSTIDITRHKTDLVVEDVMASSGDTPNRSESRRIRRRSERTNKQEEEPSSTEQIIVHDGAQDASQATHEMQ